MSFPGLLRQTTTNLMAQNNINLFLRGSRGQKSEIWSSHSPQETLGEKGLLLTAPDASRCHLARWEHPPHLYPSSHGSLLCLSSVCLKAPFFPLRMVVSELWQYHRSQMDSLKVSDYCIEAPFQGKSSMPTDTSNLETK